jgi:hypothetical protein
VQALAASAQKCLTKWYGASPERGGSYFRDETPGCSADLFIGTPAEHDARCAELIPAPLPKLDGSGGDDFLVKLLASAKPYAIKAFMNPLPLPGAFNSRAWRGAEIPAANGHGSARGLARIYSALACGGSLDGACPRAAIDRARVEQRHGPDTIPIMP